MNGKGDIQRPTQVDAKTFSDNWERIFSSGLPERPIGLGSNPSSDLTVANVGSNPTAAATRSCSSEVEQRVVNPSVGGSNPSGNAIYIDDATG